MHPGEIKTALVTNPRSRRARERPSFIPDLKAEFGNHGPIFDSGDEIDLLAFLQDCAEREVNLLFVCGGDGTLRMVLDKVAVIYPKGRMPRIGLLRGGTMNVVASSLGIRRDPRKTLRKYLTKISNGEPLKLHERRLLKVNDRHGFIFVAGGFSNFLDVYYQKAKPTPLWGLYLVFRVILSRFFKGPFFRSLFAPISTELHIDGSMTEVQHTVTFSGASIQDIGFGARPYLTDYGTGSFGYFGFRSIPWAFPFFLPSLLLAKEIKHPQILQGAAQSIQLKFETPIKPYLDGDHLEPMSEFNLSLGAKVECVVP